MDSPVSPAALSSSVPSRLSAQGLSHRYGQHAALSDFSFHLQPGELLGFVGPNGAGKTTLFRILCGLITPLAGTLALDGQPVSARDATLRRQLGVVFQEPSLDARLTVAENLRMTAVMHRLSRPDADERIHRLLTLVKLTDRASARVETLSGGMRRRVELVRALLPRPRILLLDEPTTGVDMAGVRDFWAFVDQVRAQEGTGVLLTTHRADEAESCTRVVLMHGGRAVATDTPDALMAQAGGDILTLECAQPQDVAQSISALVGAPARVDRDRVSVEVAAAHTWVPRVMEALAGQRVHSVMVRRPGMAEVFARLTGRALAAEAV
jgi:ABC-2 type transport system ATP-binding protein